MRIESLKILSPWKNLCGFSIDFDLTRDVAVLIGRNGSAKSNLLETLISIFTSIDLGEPAPFSYNIEYLISGESVNITADVDNQAHATVGGKSISSQDLRSNWTPKYLVGYYSGTSDRFDQLFQKHDLLARNLTLVEANNTKPSKLPFRRFINGRPEHGLFALISFYFSKDNQIEDFLRETIKIEGFDSTLLVLHKPSWAKSGATPEDFWGARGPVRELLSCIRKNSLAPFARSVRLRQGFAKRETKELLYLYLPDIAALEAVASQYSYDPKALFQAMDTMRLSDLIEDLRVRVRVIGATGAIHTRQLSEGEQQLLTVLGLMRFTRNESSLYLLDEPDTHLNPAWEVDYLEMLRKIGGVERKSHTIIATHDPLLVAGLLRQEIRVLTRTADGRIIASEPEENPRGTGVASVLTSPIYGLESQLDPFSLKVLKRIYDVSLEERSEFRSRYLQRLGKLLPIIAVAGTSPDPYRNIARDAYQLAQTYILNSNVNSNMKTRIIDRLATKLYEEVK
jgi:predicted ATPase